MPEYSPLLMEILREAIFLLLIVGSAFSLLIGLFFLLMPSVAIQFNQRVSRWTSMRRSSKSLEIPHYTDRAIYRYHRAYGLLIMAGAIFVLYQLGFHYQHHMLLQSVGSQLSHQWIAEWLINALLWFVTPTMLAILLFGAALATRPSSLKGFEQQSNRWISSRQWLLPLEKQYLVLDRLIQHQPRTFGFLVAVLSTYGLASLLLIYIHYHP